MDPGKNAKGDGSRVPAPNRDTVKPTRSIGSEKGTQTGQEITSLCVAVKIAEFRLLDTRACVSRGQGELTSPGIGQVNRNGGTGAAAIHCCAVILEAIITRGSHLSVR